MSKIFVIRIGGDRRNESDECVPIDVSFNDGIVLLGDPVDPEGLFDTVRVIEPE